MKLLILSVTALLCLQLALAAPVEKTKEEYMAEAIISICDDNNDKGVSLEELKKGGAILDTMKTNLSVNFKLFDINGDGKLNKTEIKMLKELPDIVFRLADININQEVTEKEMKSAIERLINILSKVIEHIKAKDASNDGKLNKDELAKLVASLEDENERSIFKALMSNCDVDNDGKLSKVEAENGLKIFIHALEKVGEEFAKLDTNGDKHLDRKEFEGIVKKLYNGITPEVLLGILSIGDTDGDTTLSESELKAGLEKYKEVLNTAVENFDKADTVKDKKLDKHELMKLFTPKKA